jgi:DNA-directed RNA polymerase subunit N (RpoN/RPB10)
MIIPVRCFTCGKLIGDKYRWYLERVAELKEQRVKDKKR